MIGRLVGPYKILSKIGAGGMGEVYLAEHTELGRKVALKFVAAGATAEALSRFHREAQAAAALHHRSIVTIYDVGIDADRDRPFIAMEFVDGKPLTACIRTDALSVERALDIAIDVLEGLSKAHQAGIVHRDLKPDNIFLDGCECVRILDFGLAKISGAPQLTGEATRLGTVPYMSPEQLLGQDIDARSDLFSLGVILYEMITGRRPFDGPHTAAIEHAILNSTAEPLSRFRRNISPEHERIINKLLEKDPAHRYATADDLLVDLRRVRNGHKTASRSKALSPWAIAAAVAGVVVATAMILAPDDGKHAKTRPLLVVLPFENLGPAKDEYFSDGVTDEIIARLAMIKEIAVISRTSSMQYKSVKKSSRDIARELGVSYILEGSVRWDQESGRVRITPQLIRATDDTHLWAQTYEREVEAIFAVQAEIAGEIAHALQITLVDAEHDAIATVPTRNVDAYTAYLRARQMIDTADDAADFAGAMGLLTSAVTLDSTFATAYGTRAVLHAYLFHRGWDRTAQRLELANADLKRAVALAPDMPQINIAQAYYLYWGFHRYNDALASLERAEAHLPDDADIHSTTAWIYRRQGRYEEAIDRLHRALRLDPKSVRLLHDLAQTHTANATYAVADSCYARLMAVAPDYLITYSSAADNILLWKGDLSRANAIMAKAPPDNPETLLYARARLFWLAGDRKCVDLLDHATKSDANITDTTFQPNDLLAGIYLHTLGEPDLARERFERACVRLEQLVDEHPEDFRLYGALGLSLAGLGLEEDAVRAGKTALEMYPPKQDHFNGASLITDMAWIYILTGENDDAMDRIDDLVDMKRMTPELLRIEPIYQSLRQEKRFQELVGPNV
jgi:serine/threonine protein kinase/tetratricopeptide (TPR) repeat protein